MSNPHYDDYRHDAGRREDRWNPGDLADHAGAWLLLALAALAITATAWFGAMPRNDQATAATRIPIATNYETSGRPASRP